MCRTPRSSTSLCRFACVSAPAAIKIPIVRPCAHMRACTICVVPCRVYQHHPASSLYRCSSGTRTFCGKVWYLRGVSASAIHGHRCASGQRGAGGKRERARGIVNEGRGKGNAERPNEGTHGSRMIHPNAPTMLAAHAPPIRPYSWRAAVSFSFCIGVSASQRARSRASCVSSSCLPTPVLHEPASQSVSQTSAGQSRALVAKGTCGREWGQEK